MREIIFRGKRIDNGEWVNGTPFISQNCCKMIFAMALHPDFVEDGNVYYSEGYPVDPETVDQYTGLTDKNGTKIFEGDIIECWSEGVKAKGTVQKRKDGLWIIYPAWQKTITWGLCPDEYCHTTVEVIGNIHDNPELLD